MLDRLLSLVVAVGLGLLVWIYARSRDQETLDNVAVPVQVVVAPRQADHYTLELTGPAQVPVTFTGPPARVRELQGLLRHKELQVVLTVTVPDGHLDEARYSDVVQVEAGDVHAPTGVTALVHEGRNRVPFTLHRLTERRLPVRFDPLDDGPAGAVVIDPPTVLVRGPQEVLDRARDVPTQPAELPARSPRARAGAAAVGRVPLVQELEGRPVKVTPGHVVLKVPSRKLQVYELTDVPVQFLCPADFRHKPKFTYARDGRVNLRLVGPVQDEPPRVYAFVDLSRGEFRSGLNHDTLQLQLPKDFTLAQDPPRVVAFELEPADFLPRGQGRDSGP